MSYQQAIALMSKSVSRPTLYSVRIPFNPFTGGGVDDFTNSYLQFFCKATALPEARADTFTVLGQSDMGVAREQPGAILFSKPFTIEVIENSDFTTYKQFRKWFNKIAKNANPRLSPLGTRTQRMRYYRTYVSDMYLSKLELPDNIKDVKTFDGDIVNAGYKEVIRFNFVNVYPTRIGAVTLDSSSFDTYSTFNVDLTYETYSIGGQLGQLDFDEETILV